MIALGISIFCLFLILMTPCGIYGAYSSAGVVGQLIVGPLRINLLKKRTKKEKKEKKVKAKKGKAQEKTAPKGKLTDFLPIAKLIFEFLADFRRKLIIKNLQFKLTLAGSDPCDLSVNYGRTWAAVGNIFPHLESLFKIQKRDIEIACDFTADTTVVDASIDLRLRLATLIHMVLHHGIRILLKYFKITKNVKDGAVS